MARLVIAQLFEGERGDHCRDGPSAEEDQGQRVESDGESPHEARAHEHDDSEDLQKQGEAQPATVIHGRTVAPTTTT